MVSAEIRRTDRGPVEPLESAIWTSSDLGVLTVTLNGRIEAVGPGRALLTVQGGGRRDVVGQPKKHGGDVRDGEDAVALNQERHRDETDAARLLDDGLGLKAKEQRDGQEQPNDGGRLQLAG